MKLDISIRTNFDLPIGYSLYRVIGYPIHGYGVDLDPMRSQPAYRDMWAIVPLWCPATGTFSAVKGNVYMIGNGDILDLITIQPTDTHTLNEKMSWLVSDGWGVTPMWTNYTGEWDEVKLYYVGVQLWAGQLAPMSDEIFNIPINSTNVPCRKVYQFKQSDWQRKDKSEWLFPYVPVARRADNSLMYEWGRGKIRTMLMVPSADYVMTGGILPSGFYLPVAWMET